MRKRVKKMRKMIPLKTSEVTNADNELPVGVELELLVEFDDILCPARKTKQSKRN